MEHSGKFERGWRLPVRSIKTKILVPQLCLVLLICSLLGGASYVLLVDALMKTQEKHLTNIARDQAEKLAYHIRHKEEKFRAISLSEPIEAYSREYHEPVLIQHFNSFMDEFPILAYVREDGLEEMKLVNGHERPERLSDISKTFLFEESTWTPNKVLTIFPSPSGNDLDPIVQFAYCRLNFFGEFEGLIVGGIPLNDFVGSIGDFTFDDQGFLILIDTGANILYHPAPDIILKRIIPGDRFSEKVLERATSLSSGFERATFMDLDGFVAFAPVPERGLAVLATLPYQAFMESPNNLKYTLIAISLTVLALAIFFSLILARNITGPLLKLSHATGLLARGDLSHTVDIRSEDEIGLLAQSFNEMTRDLREAVHSRDQEIQERKRAEEERRKLEVQVQRAQRMEALGTLAGGVAHDLNNILGAIVSYPELLLLDLPENSPMRKPLMAVQQSGERAATIVQDLLTLARRGVISSEKISLNTIVDDYLRSPEHEQLLNRHPQVKFDVHLQRDLMAICGSPVHLSKTVMNLVFNAAEAMPDGGTVSISTHNMYVDKPIRGYDHVEEGEYVTFTVSDTGIGIPARDIGRIFEPFYTKKVMGRSGTGLGMAVIWGTVKDHKGYICVQSREGDGSTFTLYFPVAGEEEDGTSSTLTIEDYRGNGESILVVDDIHEQRDLASTMLGKLGYSVVTAASGEEAVEYLKRQSVDLLLLDMIMDPGIDGLETYKRVLELHPSQKAVIVSGFSETHRVREAERLGAGGYVMKPYDLEKIGITVKEVLARD